MGFLRGNVGTGKWVVLVLGALLIAACSGSSEGDDDEGDDGGGGTSGTGGTFGTGGASGTGGTSSGCAQYCQRLAACPEGSDPTCQAECADVEDLSDASGCSTEFDRLLACFARIDVCNPPANACGAELLAASDCVDGGSPGGCPPAGTGPANGDCVAACQRANACPGAEQVNCAQSCADAAAEAQMYGCTLEYQRVNGCFSACTDICAATSDDCYPEIIAYVDCITSGGGI